MSVYERLRQAMAPAGNDPRLDAFLGYGLHLAAETLVQLAPAKAAQAAALDKIVELAEFVALNWNAVPDAVPDAEPAVQVQGFSQVQSPVESAPEIAPESDPNNPIETPAPSPVPTDAYLAAFLAA